MLEGIVKKTNLNDVLIIFIASLAIIGIWRGVWNLLDRYLFPGNFILSQGISILIGVIILILIARYK